MGLINAIKSVFIYNNELKAIKEAYSGFFDFCEEYGYEPTDTMKVVIDSHYHTSTSLNFYSTRIRENYGEVIRFMLIYKRSADLIAICKEYTQTIRQPLYIPSEISECQYITLFGWRHNVKKWDTHYHSSIVFGFGKHWCPPRIIDGEFKVKEGLHEYIDFHVPKEFIIHHYSSFIKKVVEDLIRDIKYYYEGFDYGWYIKKMVPKYEDKIPILFWEEEENPIPIGLRKSNNNRKEKAISSSIIVKQTWSLLDFAREYGPKMFVSEFINKDTKKKFDACKFVKPDGTITLVSFGKKLGELTPEEIANRKSQLKVAKWIKENKEEYTLYE